MVVTKPAGLVAVKALPDDFEPMQAGSTVYFRSKGRYYAAYLDPGGEESYVVVDAPAGAVPAVPGEPGAAPKAATTVASGAKPKAAAAAAPAPAPAAKAVTLTAQPGTPADGARGHRGQLGHRAGGPALPGQPRCRPRRRRTRRRHPGTRVYGRVVAAKAGTGTGGAPQLTVELTDVEVGGRVVPLSTEPVSFTGEAKKAGKKVLGGAALGAGIGGMIDGGEGAAWGAAAGAVVGSRPPSRPGNQVAVSAGTALEFRLAKPLSVDIVV